MSGDAQPVEIDGSFGEGGGQMLRTALGLSAVLGKPFVMTNIRAKRRRPGLQNQHLRAVELMQQLTKAEVRGNFIGSDELKFIPKRRPEGSVSMQTGTAASLMLIIQPVIIASLAGGEIVADLKGGTDVPMAPTSDYVKYVELPLLRSFGLVASIDIVRRGYYPAGGGYVRFWVMGWSPAPLHVRRGESIREIRVHALACSLPKHVAEREAQAAVEFIRSTLGLQSKTLTSTCNESVGTNVLVYADLVTSLLGADALGEKGKPAELVGSEAAESLVREVKSNASVDVHMGDMLLPFIGLRGGSFSVRDLTAHMMSNSYVVKQFTGTQIKFERQGDLWFVSA
ncbi:MAG: RNA 3'-terminal phosphate cyclase [Thermoprotei archaeon]